VTQDSGIEGRLQLVEDRLALLELEGAYAKEFDSRSGDAWAALFTEDGVYRSRPHPDVPPGDLIVLRGRAELARFCHGFELSGIHRLGVPSLQVTGDDATGRVHFDSVATGVDGNGAVQLRALTGFYDVRYRRTVEGWRIAYRVTSALRRAREALYAYPTEPAWDVLGEP